MKKILPDSFYNPITLSGAAISIVSFGLILFLMLVESLTPNPKPYMGIIAFVILPIFLIFGLAFAILGIRREHYQKAHGLGLEHKLPKIDLNDPKHRKAFVIFSVVSILLLMFSAFGSFKAYEYTDSDEFCGTICHSVMNPEFVAYQYSPHARVGCVKCHIGSGADWFVRSKLSGTYQVYATMFNLYPRPIPTPIENLRPAQETCEQCHWPKHFFSEKQRENTYYLSDENNTKWTLHLLMRIGGGNIEAGPTSGIHWHMNINNQIDYAAIDTQRNIIPWVKVKRADGSESIYRSTEEKINDEDIAKIKKRRMDCIDCHNRPTHIYHPPARSIDHVMSLGWIDSNLPYVKGLIVSALEHNYTSREIGLDSIKIIIEDFYEKNYPELALLMSKEIKRTVREVQKIYQRNYFPEMRVNWKRFADHIGHLYYPGCFRCHGGKHVNESGQVLSKDCNICHTILAQHFEKDKLRLSLGGVEYIHPVDIGNAWMEMNCSDCHNKK